LPEELLFHREHVHRSVHANPSRHALMAFQDPSNARGIVFPAWRVLRDYLASIWRAPLGWNARLACAVHMLRWVKYHRDELFEDLAIAAKQIAGRSTDRQAHA